jgi:hypothetical protein
MLRDKTIIKLEAIAYCLNGLIEGKALTMRERIKLVQMHREIEKMQRQFEGVSIYDESANAGC